MGRTMRVLDEIETYVTESPYAELGWTAFRAGRGVVKFVREGYSRVVVTYVGGDTFVLTWQYDAGDWRAAQYARDEIGVQAHMTMNAFDATEMARVE